MRVAGRVLLLAAGAVNQAAPAGPRKGGPQGHAQGQSLQGCLQAGEGVLSAPFTTLPDQHPLHSSQMILVRTEAPLCLFLIRNAA